jgi:hypothetical protein
MRKGTIRIRKEEFPTPRRIWERRPATQITPSKKVYSRGRAKANARKLIANGLKRKNKKG